MPKQKDPTTITIGGRLSFPVFSHAEAVERNSRSDYPIADPSKVAPEFNLLVERPALDKLKTHILDVFLPFCVAREKAGESRNALTKKDADRIAKLIETEDWENQPPYIPIKVVPEKTEELAPDALASIKVKGMRGQDLEQKAVVQSEDELAVPDDKILSYPVLRPIGQTIHQLYGGCYAAATLNLYAFLSGKVPGITASSSVCVYKGEGEHFGGGIEVDEDAIFED